MTELQEKMELKISAFRDELIQYKKDGAYTYEDLEEICEVSKPNIYNFIRKAAGMHSRSLVKISLATGISI